MNMKPTLTVSVGTKWLFHKIDEKPLQKISEYEIRWLKTAVLNRFLLQRFQSLLPTY